MGSAGSAMWGDRGEGSLWPWGESTCMHNRCLVMPALDGGGASPPTLISQTHEDPWGGGNSGRMGWGWIKQK